MRSARKGRGGEDRALLWENWLGVESVVSAAVNLEAMLP